ncbi:hypothetical protein GRF29_28g2812229 [Pseudopithomyces chartarum]|uniref:Uncharacterized protein n=1 Tax=Pseudopithomyces chartarum TaxID=1892770 RepID=A0AAN6M255_9PLEO|nr:hypothetical protein GRF29_28g2812229 [Pseudopithomyces chartarum]
MTLLTYILTLISYLSTHVFASPPEVYHNHAVWYIGNTTNPSAPNSPNVANGLTTIVNRCPYPIYIWEAHEAYQDLHPALIPARAQKSYPIKSTYPIPQHDPCIDNCGVTYKISRTASLVGGPGGNQIQFEYSTRGAILYHDISFVDCAVVTGWQEGDAKMCPGWELAVGIEGVSGGKCKNLECGVREMCIHDAQGAYYIDDPTLKWGLGAPIGTCPGYKTGTEVKFVMCASAAPIQKEES